MRTLLASLCLFLAVAHPASAASSPHWLQVSTDHFTVITDSSERDARHTAAQFERMRALFNTILPRGVSNDSEPIVVLALRNKKEFDALEPSSYLAKNSLSLAGYFLTTPGRNYILLRLDTEGDHPFATIYHEYTHYITRNVTAMPLWLNEGIAEFYQNTDIEDKDIRLGQPSSDDILYLRNNRLVPLATLFAVDHNSPYYHDEQKGSIFYAESWALVHYLEVTDFKQKTHRLHDYLSDLLQNQDPVVAAQNAFGDLGQLQKALDNYVTQMSFSYFKVNSAININEAALKVAPAADTDVDATRADVLAFNERTDEAKAIADSVLKADPQNELADEAMGDICYTQRDRACSLKWYSEAVQHNTQNPWVLYTYAIDLLQSQQSGHDDEIESDLKKCVQLDSHFAPGYDALANFYATRHKNVSGVQMAILQAISLDPHQLVYRLNASNAWMQLDRPDNAIGVLKTAKADFRSPSDVAILDQRIQQIQEYQASVAAAQAPISGGSTKTIVLIKDGAPTPEPKPYPDGPSTGPHHTASGVIGNVQCSYPTVLTLSLTGPKQPVTLYSNNFFKVPFTTLNFQPTGDLDVCHQLKGMKARIAYAEVSDPRVAGQIISVELSK